MLDEAVAKARGEYAARHPVSADLHARAIAVMPGGNTRSVLHFEPFPFRAKSAAASQLVDEDGHAYTDFLGNYTAGLFGHSPKIVLDAVSVAMESGVALGATHAREIELAELLCNRFEALDRVRFTNSGTEANLMAIGTALHHTGKDGVGVFSGAYHGGLLSFGPGDHPLNVPHRFVQTEFNRIDELDGLFADGELGCVLVEAVQGAGGCLPASVEFLQELRRRCDTSGALLIFDEVMTSRLSPGGAQQLFGVTPDMMTLGKYLGGGMTFGAFGGRSDIMDHFDPAAGGALTQAGTFNNNVVTMAAAVAAVSELLDDDRLDGVNSRGDRLRNRLASVFEESGRRLWVTGLGSMLSIHAEDDRLLELLFHHLLVNGIYIARRGFIALSFEITDADCDALIGSVTNWLQQPL